MNLLKYLLVLGVFTSLIIGCKNTSNSSFNEVRTQISGSMENGAGKMLFVNAIVNNRGKIIDTIMIKEDNTFNHTIKSALDLDYYVLSNKKKNNQVYLITDSTEAVTLNGNYDQLSALSNVEGSEATSVFMEFSKMASVTANKLAKFDNQIIAAKTSEEKKAIGAKKKALKEADMRATESFIDANSDNAGIAAFFEIIDFTKHPKLSQKTINHLAKLVPNSSYYKTRAQQVTQYANPNVKIAKRPDIGKVAAKIELNDPAGKLRTLYELRGKTVLVDFWASWCGPCRRENPNVVKAYKKYHDAGFEVLSVSLDSDKARWVKAIEEDGLIWDTHVSDLLKWQTPLKTAYNFSGIPHAVLVDADGVIIDSKIRGAKLEEYLEGIFGY